MKLHSTEVPQIITHMLWVFATRNLFSHRSESVRLFNATLSRMDEPDGRFRGLAIFAPTERQRGRMMGCHSCRLGVALARIALERLRLRAANLNVEE